MCSTLSAIWTSRSATCGGLPTSPAAPTSDTSNKLVTQVVAALGHSFAAASRYDEAIELLDEAIETKRRYSNSSALSVTLAYSTMCKAMALADRGDLEAANLAAEQSVDAVGDSGHEVEGSILRRCGRPFTSGRTAGPTR